MHIYSDLASVKALEISKTQVAELFNGFSEVNNAEESFGLLNTPQSFDKDQRTFEIVQ